jgi:hypothetical protein
MCGRFTLRTPPRDIVEVFQLLHALEMTPRYNIAPTQSVAFIFEQIELRRAGSRIDQIHLFPFFEEQPVHPHVGFDRYRIVIDQVVLPNRPFVLVAVDHIVEIGLRVTRRRGGQTDLDGVEMVQRVPPNRELAARVPTTTFVGNDAVEGMDRKVEFIGLVVSLLILLGECELLTACALEDRSVASRRPAYAVQFERLCYGLGATTDHCHARKFKIGDDL